MRSKSTTTSESSDGSSRFHVADECDPTGSKGVDRSQAFGMTNTLSHHEGNYQPGGLAEKSETLQALTGVTGSKTPKDAIERLQLRHRHQLRSMELKATLPDSSILCRALSGMAEMGTLRLRLCNKLAGFLHPDPGQHVQTVNKDPASSGVLSRVASRARLASLNMPPLVMHGIDAGHAHQPLIARRTVPTRATGGHTSKPGQPAVAGTWWWGNVFFHVSQTNGQSAGRKSYSTLLYSTLLLITNLYSTPTVLFSTPPLYSTLLFSTHTTLLYYSLPLYSTLLFSAILYSCYSSLLFSTPLLYSTILQLYSTLHYYSLLRSTLHYHSLLYTILYSTLLFSTILNSTLL